MSINFGKYDQQIIIQNYTETTVNGFPERSYSTLYSVWANVMPKGGSESQQDNEKVANIIIYVEVRATGLTINETMRIVWRNKTYNIVTIDEFGSRRREGYFIRAVAKDNS